jgi:hypothetical protein
MNQILKRVVAVLTSSMVCAAIAWANDPYPHKTKPREDKKEEVLNIDFEGVLPPGHQLGKNAKVEMGTGKDGSQGLVAKGRGSVLKVPLKGIGVGMSRYEVLVDFAGEGFNMFTVSLIPYGKDGKPIAGRKTVVGSDWGFTPEMHTWDRHVADLEIEGIHTVELEIEIARADSSARGSSLRLDNILVYRHDTPVVLGSQARGYLKAEIHNEGAELTESGDTWVAELKGRQSFFNVAAIDPNRRYLNSLWPERLHLGSTYKQPTGNLPDWVLGVAATQAGLDTAAVALNKSIDETYEFFLDDVAQHGFNLVLVDVTKDIEKFDEFAAARNIAVILQDPTWSGLSEWWSKLSDMPPDAFKQSAEANLKRYSTLRSIVGYDTSPSLGVQQQPVLAKAREYMATIAPNVQLCGEFADVYGSENIEEPYPAFGLQTSTPDHYAGRPWVEPSYMFHPNYWPRYLSEGWVRRIHNGLTVRSIPNVWVVPASRAYSKKSISFQQDRVVTATTNWVWDEETKKWSGWNRYQYPPQLMTSLVWMALQSGARGIIFRDWGPSNMDPTVTGSEILRDDKYVNATYEPDLLRRADMSESDGWKELGQVAKSLEKYKRVLAESTAFGRTIATTNTGDVYVKCLTGRKDPFKVLVVANTKIGDYLDDRVSLKIDKDSGALVGWKSAGNKAFKLTVDDERDLFDLTSGDSASGSAPKKGKRDFDLMLAPGEGRLYYLGNAAMFRRFISQYNLEGDLAAGATKSKTVTPQNKSKTKSK